LLPLQTEIPVLMLQGQQQQLQLPPAAPHPHEAGQLHWCV
jgi:hypothetical protein